MSPITERCAQSCGHTFADALHYLRPRDRSLCAECRIPPAKDDPEKAVPDRQGYRRHGNVGNRRLWKGGLIGTPPAAVPGQLSCPKEKGQQTGDLNFIKPEQKSRQLAIWGLPHNSGLLRSKRNRMHRFRTPMTLLLSLSTSLIRM